jgi:replicative DNA helicase
MNKVNLLNQRILTLLETKKNKKNMIHSYELEKQLLAGLIKDPNSFTDICSFINEKDFYCEDSVLHKTIFTIIKQAIQNGEDIDDVIIAQRVLLIGLSFEDNINVADYIKSLSIRKLSDSSVVKAAKELKKFTIRREIFESSIEVSKRMKTLPPESSYLDIVNSADKIYNSRINYYEIGNDVPQNIYDDMEAVIEELGNNPIKEFGMMGPYKKVNEIYGSLLRPGNITVIVARSGVGKSTLSLDYCTKVAEAYSVPVLHFDNGEMSKDELMFRQCAALSGVSMHLLENGSWRKAGNEVVEKIKNLKFYYYNVAGMNVDSMINVLKRFYFSQVGRGNKMIFSFDYIKTTSERSDKNEWQLVGEMIDKFKQCIQKELVIDNKPIISMFTSVQSNRTGITNNRSAANVIDDESTVSLSDRIIQFCSHMFILRNKTIDEIQEDGGRFGTHKLINIKARHLGSDIAGALEPILVGDVLRKNFINLEFKNFNITEKGDLRDIVRFRDGHEEIERNHNNHDIPDFDEL